MGGFSAGFHRAKDPTLPSNMKFLLVVALIGSATAIETVGLHQQTPVQYGSQIGPVLYGALGEGGLVSESRTLPDEAGPKMSALPTSGLKIVPKSLKPAQPLVYRPNPYVYIPAIGQVAKPGETVGNVEPRTVPEGLKPVATNLFVYTASPFVYAHHMNPIHPYQIDAEPLPGTHLAPTLTQPGYIPTIVTPARAPAPDIFAPKISEETDPKLVAQALAPGYIPTLVVPARAPTPGGYNPKRGVLPGDLEAPEGELESLAPGYIPTIVTPARAPTPGGGLGPPPIGPPPFSPVAPARAPAPSAPEYIPTISDQNTIPNDDIAKVDPVGNVEPRTAPEGLKPVVTNPFVYTASPYVYAHHMNPVHPNQITPIVPHGLAYSFTSGHASVVKVPKPEETLVNAELRTVEEGVEPVATNPFAYDASPYVYAHPMNPVHPTQNKPVVSHGFAYYGSPDGTIQSRGRTNPVHPTQIKPVVPHGFAYSFTVGNENVAAQRCTCEVHPFCCVF